MTDDRGALVLVTGGGGFLGSAIVRMLRERGQAVRSLARHFYPAVDALGASRLKATWPTQRSSREPSRGVPRSSTWRPRRDSGGRIPSIIAATWWGPRTSSPPAGSTGCEG